LYPKLKCLNNNAITWSILKFFGFIKATLPLFLTSIKIVKINITTSLAKPASFDFSISLTILTVKGPTTLGTVFKTTPSYKAPANENV